MNPTGFRPVITVSGGSPRPAVSGLPLSARAAPDQDAQPLQPLYGAGPAHTGSIAPLPDIAISTPAWSTHRQAHLALGQPSRCRHIWRHFSRLPAGLSNLH